jgi:hypothetical protein
MGIHRRFIAPRYRRGCPVATPDRLHNRASWPPVRQAKLAGGLAGFFQQLDISHGSPRDERSPGVVFFGAFFFDGFYGDATGVVFDQPSVEAAPVRLRSPGILPLCEPVPPVLGRQVPSSVLQAGGGSHLRYIGFW